MQTKHRKIAVQLEHLAVYPVCAAALEAWKHRTRFKSCEVTILNRMNGEKTKAWIDDKLFKLAIFNLMEIAAQSCRKHDRLSFSIITGWQGSCLIIIGYPLTIKKSNTCYENAMNTRPDAETTEIISQHRGKIEITEEKLRGSFLIHLPH